MSGLRFSVALLVRSIVGLALGSVGGAALTDMGVMAFASLVAAQGSNSSPNVFLMLGSGLAYGAMRGAFLVLPLALIACWPLHLVLSYIGWRNLFVYGIAWAAMMLVAFLVAPYYLGNASLGWIVGTQLSTGFIAGILFWLIRRPDLDTKRPASDAEARPPEGLQP